MCLFTYLWYNPPPVWIFSLFSCADIPKIYLHLNSCKDMHVVGANPDLQFIATGCTTYFVHSVQKLGQLKETLPRLARVVGGFAHGPPHLLDVVHPHLLKRCLVFQSIFRNCWEENKRPRHQRARTPPHTYRVAYRLSLMLFFMWTLLFFQVVQTYFDPLYIHTYIFWYMLCNF